MNRSSTDQLSNFIRDILKLAGRELMDRFQTKLTVTTKSDDSIVTNADLASEKIVIDALSKYYKDDLIYSEEAGLSSKLRTEGQAIWVIDPLDGTSNFANGYPYFCVSVGRGVFGKDNQIHMTHGGIIDPVHDKVYLAAKGQGATCNGKKLEVAPPRDLARCFLVTGFYYLKDQALADQIQRFLKVAQSCSTIRRDGAAALDLALVAEGIFDGFWEYGLQPWDVAAGSLIVEEAGGVVRNYYQDPFNVEKEGVIAGNAPTVGRLVNLVT